METYVTNTRDKKAALRFMKTALKRRGSPQATTTDGLRPHRVALIDHDDADKQEAGCCCANNGVENSHLPFR